MPRNKYDWLAFLLFLACLAAIIQPGLWSIPILLVAGRMMINCSRRGDDAYKQKKENTL